MEAILNFKVPGALGTLAEQWTIYSKKRSSSSRALSRLTMRRGSEGLDPFS
jgi:hypothetical protein